MVINVDGVKRALAPYGGVVSRSDGKHPHIEEFRDHFSRSAQCGPEWDIVTDVAREFVDNSAFNAIALQDNGQEIIALYKGLVNFLVCFNTASLMWPSAWRSLSFPDCTDQAPDSRRPLGPESISLPRMAFTMEARMAGLYFVLSHETGHIARGHLDYLGRNAGHNSFGEFGAARRAALPSIALQALEIDADAYAALAMAWTLLNVPQTRPDILSKQARLSARLFGLTVLFGKMSEVDIKESTSPESRTHPTARLRFSLAATRIKDELTRSAYVNDNEFDDIVGRCIDEARRSWLELTGHEWGIDTADGDVALPSIVAAAAEMQSSLVPLEDDRARRCRARDR